MSKAVQRVEGFTPSKMEKFLHRLDMWKIRYFHKLGQKQLFQKLSNTYSRILTFCRLLYLPKIWGGFKTLSALCVLVIICSGINHQMIKHEKRKALVTDYNFSQIETETPTCLVGQIEDMSSGKCVWRTKYFSFGMNSEIEKAGLDATVERSKNATENKNYQLAVALLEPLVHRGYPAAQYHLATMYNEGLGVQENQQSADFLYTFAAKQGHPEAQFELARKITEDCETKCPNIQTAIKYYTNAANSGIDIASEELARIYLEGVGVPKDSELAIKWISKAAEANLVKSQRVLGELYYYGRIIERNFEKAFYWIEKAALGGDPRAAFQVGTMYMNGVGVEKDEKKSVELVWISAVEGFIKGQTVIGMTFLDKNFGPNDELRGLMWLHMASESGSEQAREFLTNALNDVSGETYKVAKVLAKECDEKELCGIPPWYSDDNFIETTL